MLETLTVELDSELVDRLHRYCREHGVTVADVLSDLIRTLSIAESPRDEPGTDEEWRRTLPPITRRLLGAASGEADEADYKEYLWQKYGPGT